MTTFTCYYQPYGPFTIEVDEIEIDGSPYPYYGCMGPEMIRTLSGRVIEGSETSRLFTASNTKSIAGQRRTVYGVKPWEWAAGKCVRVAM